MNMFNFTIDNSVFLNEFYSDFKEYVKSSYGFSAKYLINPVFMEDYKEQEKVTLLLINKSIFQNIFNMLAQLDNNMVFSALSCLENALYNIRLFKVLKANRNNLYKYITEDDFDLEKYENIIEINTDVEEKHEFSIVDFYKEIKNTNRFKEINKILPPQINNGNVYMGLSNGNSLSDKLEDNIRRYIAATYEALSIHNHMFFNGGIDNEAEEIDGNMFKKFMEYVKIYA